VAHSVLQEPSDSQLASLLQELQVSLVNPSSSNNNNNLHLGARLVVSVFHNAHVLRPSLTLFC
jgi:hypothetical protein